MHSAIVAIMSLCSVLIPQKEWVPRDQPILINVQDKDVRLCLTSPAGLVFPAQGSADVAAGQQADIKKIFPFLQRPDPYLLYALPKGAEIPKQGQPKDFLGVPLVLEVMQDPTDPAVIQAMVTRIVPECYVQMKTDDGDMTIAMYYEAAPNTVNNFLSLAAGGFYDGLTFHRIVPDFVIQGGDPVANGQGGPAFHVDQEFNPRPHLPGVLSMARQGDPAENPDQGTAPRPQYANSAGSQFFICLNYANTKRLDHFYTAFAQVIDGMDVVKKIANTPVSGADGQTPQTKITIQSVEVRPVTSDHNIYAKVWPDPNKPPGNQ
jgi:peptidyl-prolyl cis-trans isomerase B (cyclophilin B)